MRNLQIVPLFLGPWKNITYLIADTRRQICAVVDPAWDAEAILKMAMRMQWQITDILCTHSHLDHVNQVTPIAEQTGAKVHMLAQEIRFAKFSAPNLIGHRHRDEIDVGHLRFYVLHTPGHTPGSACYWLQQADALWTGDTLFVQGCGRCDRIGGDAHAMFATLQNLQHTLAPNVRIFPGHDYGPTQTSRLGDEQQHNRFFKPQALDAFVRLRMMGRVGDTAVSALPAWPPNARQEA